jgi:hypothetical protein
MEEIPQVKTNREALKRILATLVAIAGMARGTSTLPRHIYRAILLLLRPAESAVRRLIIAAARGIVVVLPPFRPRKPRTRISDTVAAYRRLGLAVNLSKEDFARYQAELKAAERRAAMPRTLSLSLLDPLKNPFRIRRRYVPNRAMPRITWLDSDARLQPLPPPPSPDDPINAAKLMLRLQALGRALDDLPGQAQRFARWRARNDAAHARVKEGLEPRRPRRIWPLRGGRPPGGRLKCYDPDARRRKNTREIDEILAHCHSMALYALDRMRSDTS